jgi:hypothetical protein
MKWAKLKTKKPSESKCKGRKIANIGKENEEQKKKPTTNIANEKPKIQGRCYLVTYPITYPARQCLAWVMGREEVLSSW